MRVLFFSPFAGIWRHTILENQLIQALSTSDEIEIYSVGCGGLFPDDCTVRDYFRGREENTLQKSIEGCNKCKNARVLFETNTRAKTIKLTDYTNSHQESLVEEFVSKTQNSNLEYINFQGIEVGRMALYEIILKYKKRTTKLSEHEFSQWKSIVRNEALAIFPALEILKTVKPDAVITYNAQDGIPGTFAQLSLKLGIRTFTITGSSSPVEAATAVKIWNWGTYKAEGPSTIEWRGENPKFSLVKRDRMRLMRHEKYTYTGKSPWTYSNGRTGQNPYEFFGISKQNKIVLAVLNSEDEIFAAKVARVFSDLRTESTVFTSQSEWVKFLIKEFLNKTDIHLVIRLHPREFPNKREGQLSEQAEAWAKLLDSLPSNVHLDHPNLGFSLYDYFPYIQTLTTGWSSAAIEALLHGIPVVTYDRNLLGYPADEIVTGTSKEEYSANIALSVSMARDTKRVVFAKRWIVFSHFRGAIYLGGGLQDAHLRAFNPLFSLFLRFLNRSLNKIVPRQIKKIDLVVPRSKKDDRKIVDLIVGKKDNLHQL